MNNTGNKKSGYLVALLLMVGLAAFSNSMRELAEIHQLTIDTSRLIAQYIAPAEIPQTPEIPQVVVAKLNSCESPQAVPTVDVEWLEDVEGITEPGVQATVPAPPVKPRRVRVKPTEFQLAKLDKLTRFEFHAVPFEFKSTAFELKAKNRKQNIIKLNTRDRELILRTLNRSINLRTAS